MYNIAQGNPPQLPAKDQLSPEGIEFLKRCFEKDPRKRASATELLQCDWIMTIRQQVVVGNEVDSGYGQFSGSEAGSVSSTSARTSRQNSSVF